MPLRDGPARAPRAADRAALRPPLLGECAARPPGPPVAPAAGPRWPCLGRDGGGCGLRLGRGADQGGGAAEVGPGARSLLSGRGGRGGRMALLPRVGRDLEPGAASGSPGSGGAGAGSCFSHPCCCGCCCF